MISFKVAALSAIFRHLPLPGRLLTTALRMASLDPKSITLPIICRSRWNSFRIYIDDASDLIQQQILFRGHFEYRESLAMMRYIRSGDTVVDIGANIGWHTLIAAERVGQLGAIHAFEPMKRTFQRLSRNVAINGFDWVQLYNCGLGAASGQVQLFSHETGDIGSTSMYSGGDRKPVDTADIMVGSVAFSSFGINEIDFCKIDIEGAELDVLDGLADVLSSKKVKVLMIEINDEALSVAGRSSSELFEVLDQYFVVTNLRKPKKPVTSAADLPAFGNLLCFRK